MQLSLQHADAQDAIAAQLRDLAPRVSQDSPEPSAVPVAPAPATSPGPTSEPELRATPLNDNAGNIRSPTPSVRASHRVARIVPAVCAVVAAIVAWHFYGEDAKQRLSHLAPQFLATATALTHSIVADKTQDAATQVATPPPTAQSVSAQDAAVATPATPTQSSPAIATPAVEPPSTPTAISSEPAPAIEAMARDIASLRQSVEQLQAGQQQLTRDLAKAAEHETPSKLARQISKPTRPLRRQHVSTSVAATHSRTPYLAPQNYSHGQAYPQGAVQSEANIPPPAPVQLPSQSGDAAIPRPPMPLR
jgi:hypothetical protein